MRLLGKIIRTALSLLILDGRNGLTITGRIIIIHTYNLLQPSHRLLSQDIIITQIQSHSFRRLYCYIRFINVSETPGQSIFQNISCGLSLAARIAFAGTLILIPVRYRWVIVARPMPPLYSDYTDFLLFAVDAAMITTLILWTSSISIWHRKLTLGPRHIWIPLAGLTLAGCISAVVKLRSSAFHLPCYTPGFIILVLPFYHQRDPLGCLGHSPGRSCRLQLNQSSL